MPGPQGNQVHPSPQGKVGSSQGIRKGLAALNCPQGRRIGNGGVARGDGPNARSLNKATLLAYLITARDWVDNGRRPSARWLIMPKALVPQPSTVALVIAGQARGV